MLFLNSTQDVLRTKLPFLEIEGLCSLYTIKRPRMVYNLLYGTINWSFRGLNLCFNVLFVECKNFETAVVKSEQHFCQVPVGSTGCNSIVCASSVTLDSQAVVINTAVSFDPCTLSVNIKASESDVTITLAGVLRMMYHLELYHFNITAYGTKRVSTKYVNVLCCNITPITLWGCLVFVVDVKTHEASISLTYGVFNGVTIRILTRVEFREAQKVVSTDVSVIACNTLLPQCHDVLPVLRELLFDVDDDTATGCVDFAKLKLPCFGMYSLIFYRFFYFFWFSCLS